MEGIVDALLLKGNEAGGLVGEDSSFILLQKWLGRTELPIYLRGGMTPQVRAFLRILPSESFLKRLDALGGYAYDKPGRIKKIWPEKQA